MSASDHMGIKRADQLREGDVIDAMTLPHLTTDDAHVSRYELTLVLGTELETAECVRLDLEGLDSYGVPVDHPVLVRLA